MTDEEIQARYGRSEHGNFAAVTAVGVPHPYCIGARHVAHAADRFCGMLGREAIEDGERHGITCQMRPGGVPCPLTFAQHEQVLLVDCYKDLKGADGLIDLELHVYLLAVKDRADEDKFAGFAFNDKRQPAGAAAPKE